MTSLSPGDRVRVAKTDEVVELIGRAARPDYWVLLRNGYREIMHERYLEPVEDER